MSRGNLFVISGPSGAGKGTLVSAVLSRLSRGFLSVSVTTRPPRSGEMHGIHYYFINKDTFKTMIEKGELLEWAYYAGSDNYYGTPKAPVLDKIGEGYQVILEIEVQGALQVKKNYPEAHLIFVEPPSLDELKRRLEKRGTESEDVIIKRIETAKVELSHKMEYDYLLVNNDLETAIEELLSYIAGFAQADK